MNYQCAMKLLKHNTGIFRSAISKVSEIKNVSFPSHLPQDVSNFVKFWNVYGIEKNLNKSHVITDFILMALKNKKIKMLTNGNETRKFLYAEDCSAGLEIIMKNHNKFKSANKELHLTTNKNISIIKIAKIIKKIAHLKNINVEILRGKTKDTVQLNKKNKNNNFLNKYWRPKNSINKGILEIFEFYQKNLR